MYNFGLAQNDPDWKSWHFTTKDNPLIDPDEIEGARKTLSSFSFKQEYEASFDNAGTDVFKEDWLQYGSEPTQGSYYIAIDLAGFENINIDPIDPVNIKEAVNSDKRFAALFQFFNQGKMFLMGKQQDDSGDRHCL